MYETMTKVQAGEINLEMGGKRSYMFPHSEWVNDHMHMYFNSLEEAVTKDHEWSRLEELLRTGIEAFLGNRGLRQRFQSLLPAGPIQKKINNYSRIHIDWKWEFLEEEMGKLEPLLSDLLERFFGVTF